jgi:hypothetical protein
LLPVFSEVYTAQQQQKYEAGVASGVRTRQPGGGAKGKRRTMGDKLLFVLYDSKTYPTVDVLGTQCAMVRSKAHENLQKLSPVLHKTLVRLERMPHRAFTTPEEGKSALKGADRWLMDATERAYRRSQDDAKHREHSSGKKKSLRCKTRSCCCLTSASFFLVEL